jgi:serine/threonine protein phosphatase PrpC
MFQVAQLTAAAGKRGQDRVAVIRHTAGIVAVLADGAGGTSGGAEAADTLLLWAQAYASRATDLTHASQWAELLQRVDQQIASANGQTTGVIVALTDHGLTGASVGDSAAWTIADDPASGYDDLTANQAQKPLLGSAATRPVAFERATTVGTVLLASDGLVKYAPPRRICEVARGPDLEQAAHQLVDLVRLRSGALTDDVGVVLIRRPIAATTKAASHGRSRYTLTTDGDLVEAGDDDS